MLLDCVNVKYRNSLENTLNELDIEVLTYLENSGYSMDLMGTYYFKDMVITIMEKIVSFSSLDGEEYNNLMNEINNPYSQFYLDLARNRYDLGINTFNEYIRKAINLDEKEITGLKAYQIALDILQNRELEVETKGFTRKLDK